MRYKFRSFLILTGVLLFMVIGYAAVSVTFKFEGVAQVGSDADDFKVSFTRALLDGEDVSSTAISSGGLQLKYQSGALKLADEKSVMEFVITNNSKQYDTKMQLVCDKLDDPNAKLEIDLGSKRAEAGEHVNGTITVSLKNDYPQPEEGEEEALLEVEVSCRLKLTALERTSKGDDATELEAKEYKETLLNGADPVLADGMIPVDINDNGKVTYANINKVWYRYADKEWANAVILKDGIERMYNVGNVIKEEDIAAYFVWIPRYRYKLWNVDQADEVIEETPTGEDFAIHAIDIMFETKDVEPSAGTQNGEWLTHPAFTSFDVNGIWVGKFETGYSGATTASEAKSNKVDASKIIVKPNTYSWRYMSAGNIVRMAYNYNRALDSHMMKNTEWGAVAYLSHSRFGINEDININNNNSYMTGYSAVNPNVSTSGVDSTITQPYNTEVGYKASTTGNITGIYDMSGGTYERVAGWRVDGSNLNLEEVFKNSKYLDSYSADYEPSTRAYSHRILGDATGEMGKFYYYYNRTYKVTSTFNSWYYDQSDFASSTQYNWFIRGGNYSGYIKSGIFAFLGRNSTANDELGFRMVLAPQEKNIEE